MRVALEVKQITWPLHTQDHKPLAVVLKLYVQNVSEKPISVGDWSSQPGALLLAYGSGKLVEWGGGSQVLVDPAKGEGAKPEVPAAAPTPDKNVPPAAPALEIDLAAGATCVFENTVQFDGGRLVWPIQSGGIYHWPFKPTDTLAPGKYELRAGYEFFGAMRGANEIRSAVMITVVDKLRDAPAPATQPAAAQPATGNISGKITSTEGNAYVNATVTLFRMVDNRQEAVPGAPVRSGEDGSFRVDHIPAGKGYLLVANEDLGGSGRLGMIGRKTDVVVEAGRNTDVGAIVLESPLPHLPGPR
jgi:hypothetical protein